MASNGKAPLVRRRIAASLILLGRITASAQGGGIESTASEALIPPEPPLFALESPAASAQPSLLAPVVSRGDVSLLPMQTSSKRLFGSEELDFMQSEIPFIFPTQGFATASRQPVDVMRDLGTTRNVNAGSRYDVAAARPLPGDSLIRPNSGGKPDFGGINSDRSESSGTAASAEATNSAMASPNGLGSSVSINTATTTSLMSAPSVDIVGAGQIQVLGSSDAANTLQEAQSVQTVDVQRRSPIDFDPRIRGFHIGQVTTSSSGADWTPVRQDLDSMLSKIDPSLIDEVIVIPGPYGLRYGPGFGFVDVVTSMTPRYAQGTEFHSRLGVTSRANRGNIYGRETIYGGGANWGAIFNYGNRTGNDYATGNGTLIPASYHAQNFLGQFGYDTSPETHWEFRYQRLDQTDTEYAGQFFDVDFLLSDGFTLGYTNEVGDAIWDTLQVDGWYNRTRFAGDNQNASKRNFHVIDRVENALGYSLDAATHGDLTSSGVRSRMELGADDENQLALGTDLRYMNQGIVESFQVHDGVSSPFYTNLPTSSSYTPGAYTELSLPWHTDIRTTLGARVDWVHMTAEAAELRSNSTLPGGSDALLQNDILYAWNVINEVQLTEHWTSRLAFGHAQRTPTLAERYADGVFLGIIQSGFSRVIGNPNLDKERLYQVDASLRAQSDEWNFRLGGFHSWILDYVTYTGNVITDPTGARLLRTINTDLATLTGGEIFAERAIDRQWSVFASTQYVDGRDRQIDAPLSGISPLEGRWGLRVVDGQQGKRWGAEFSSRIVNHQDRVGALRIGTNDVVDVIPLELRTPGFTIYQIRGYCRVTDSLHVVAGIDNLTDREYIQHLNLRLPDQGAFRGTTVFEPGIAPYATVEWTY